MSLIGVESLLALPLLGLLYWLLPARRMLQNGVLLAASAAFYATWSVPLLLLLVSGAAVDYAVAHALERTSDPSRRRGLVAISLLCGVGILAWCKYAGFWAVDLSRLLPGAERLVPAVLPLGMSFYTLQRLGYVLDVRDRRISACRSPLDFLLFVLWFPQITAGPISRAGELLPQLAVERRFDLARFSSALGTILGGWMLKALGADLIGPVLVDPVFAGTAGGTGLRVVSLIAYALQVFSDFAGYSLVAIGVSRAFGLELPRNFLAPFTATSLPEFWRRWHISLNRWLFDYLFTPLTTRGALRGKLSAGFLVVFVVSGAWHGATVGFLLWGLLHGVGMVIHSVWDSWWRGRCRVDRRYVQWRKARWYRGTSWCLTQGWFILSLAPFRASTAASLIRWWHGAGSISLPVTTLAGLLLGILAVIISHVGVSGPAGALRRRWDALPPLVQGALIGAAGVVALLFAPVGAATFIYRNF